MGLGAWLLVNHLLPTIWPRRPTERFERPWIEFGFALLGVVGIIALGQLWSAGIRFPEDGTPGPIFGAINQCFIFAPIIVVLLIRRHPWTTAWLPTGKVPLRLLVGLVLAFVAVTAYALLRDGAAAPWVMFGRMWRYDHIDEMVQVFLEDLTIAILFIRLAAAIGKRWATVVIACLFAAGHIPAMMAHGANLLELAGLLRDAGLGVAAILILQRSRDILWFWCIHFCLDMTQFQKITGLG